MNTSKFKNKNGTFTAYALACGYIETREGKTEYKSLYSEHSHYHVIHAYLNNAGHSAWETFDNLTEARKFFNSIKLK